jgi:hypothetical protein
MKSLSTSGSAFEMRAASREPLSPAFCPVEHHTGDEEPAAAAGHLAPFFLIREPPRAPTFRVAVCAS